MAHEDRHARKHIQEGEDPLPLKAMAGYYLADDWEDNLLSNRDLNPEAAEHHYRIACRFRPEWTIESGSPSVLEGKLVLPAGDVTAQIVSTPCTFTTGTWRWRWRFTTTPSAGSLWPWFIFESPANRWNWEAGCLAGYTHYRITKEVDGVTTAVITSTWTPDNAEHTTTITRDTDGNWELFLDGISKGTATDTWLPALPKRTQIRNVANQEVSFAEIEVW